MKTLNGGHVINFRNPGAAKMSYIYHRSHAGKRSKHCRLFFSNEKKDGKGGVGGG